MPTSAPSPSNSGSTAKDPAAPIPESTTGTPGGTRLKRLVRPLIVLVVAAFLISTIVGAIQSIRSGSSGLDGEITPRQLMMLTFAMVTYGLGLLPAGWVLQSACGRIQSRPPIQLALIAQIVGHLGKYVPGKAMVIVLRHNILKQHGLRASSTTLAIVCETLLMMACGSTVAAAICVTLPLPSWIRMTAVATSFGCLATVSPPIFGRVLRFVRDRKFGDEKELFSDAEHSLSWSHFLHDVFLSTIAWLLMGGSFWFVLQSLPTSTTDIPYSIALAALSLSFVLGFASLIPGGAGVRESVLIAILSLSAPPATALVAAALMRIISLFVECVMAGTALAWSRRLQRENGSRV
ncbi:MAG: YbhN family protein [Planctomycetota bacterium]